ncbi:hypothetical protein [Nocardia higoensis]|uniref:hypothetical protein n=1 Tax=Nocardia higoensis TaxID=228599 RepID=UPI0012F6E81F|nr:hypothetical protein [Nocardia higoensis]
MGKVSAWLCENSDSYPERSLLIPQENGLDRSEPNVAAYISNGNIGSVKSKTAVAGGPVLALVPTLDLLEDAVHLADGQALGVVEHAEGEISGWAAATSALNLETGEPSDDVPPTIREALEDLHSAGYNGYGRNRETYFKNLYGPPIKILTRSGYSFDFISSYLVALGGHARSMSDLKKIYR